MKFCTGCGNKLKEEAKFCGSCGNKLEGFSEKKAHKKEIREGLTNYECRYCGKVFNSELIFLRHEKNCPDRGVGQRIQSEMDTVLEDNKQTTAKYSTITVIIIIIVIAAIVLMVLYNQGAAERTAVGQIKSLFN